MTSDSRRRRGANSPSYCARSATCSGPMTRPTSSIPTSARPDRQVVEKRPAGAASSRHRHQTLEAGSGRAILVGRELDPRRRSCPHACAGRGRVQERSPLARPQCRKDQRVDDAERRRRAPATAGEIGNVDRPASSRRRLRAELDHRAEGRCVVDIHVRRFSGA